MGNSLDELRTEIEYALKALTHKERPQELFTPIWYTLESGGKRIRPVLCLAVYDWISPLRADLASAMPVALAIEIFHNFTLLHDDLMDDSRIRRGRATVWANWDANTAILSGDAMSIVAYTQLAKAPSEKLPALLQRFNEGALRVCKGQQWDMEFEHASLVEVGAYMEMIEYKTAALLEMSVRLGGCLASCTEETEELLVQFARELGVAFQLQDDFLDVYGSTEEFGKECGDDIVTNKQTYLSVLAQTQASDSQREQWEGYKQLGQEHRAEKIAKVLRLYEALSIREQGVAAIEAHLSRAEELLLQCERKIGRIHPAVRALFQSLNGRKF
ncbi:MAG: polyprenyl synthetase family protein [Bacteroides sp.]